MTLHKLLLYTLMLTTSMQVAQAGFNDFYKNTHQWFSGLYGNINPKINTNYAIAGCLGLGALCGLTWWYKKNNKSSSSTKEIVTTVLSEIKTWQNIEPFVGSIVAYTTTSEELGKGRGYSLYQGNSTKYGYIWPHLLTRETANVEEYRVYQKPVGYILYQLVKEEECGDYYELTDCSIAEANLLMRAATMQEIEQISIAISDNARFGNRFGNYHQKESNKILQGCKQLKKQSAEHLATALSRCYNAHEQNPTLPPVQYAVLPSEILLYITQIKYGVEE